MRLFPVMRQDEPVALEGGGIDVNGRGTLLTTEECFLDQKTQCRNPGMTREEYNRVFRDNLGTPNVIWLGHGIAGDDTHGHVDDLCRFIDPSTMVVVQEKNERDVNFAPLRENWERLQDARLQDGARPQVIALPMPAPLYHGDWRLPASYANFYIANAAVIVPTFNDPADRSALGILGELFRDRPVVGIHAVDLVLGFGTLHCLTQQQPAPTTCATGIASGAD
jgi:agmatine deiminase